MEWTAFKIKRVARKPATRIAFGSVTLLTVTSVAQHWFVKSEVFATLKAEMDEWTNTVAKEIAYRDGWNLTGYRNASLNVPSWYVFTASGLTIDIEGVVPGLLPPVVVPSGDMFLHPKTVTTDIGEKWRLLGKRVDGGVVILGIVEHGDNQSADAKLVANAAKFSGTVEDAKSVSSREVDFEVDYAVVSDSGEIFAAWGGMPLHLRSPLTSRFQGATTPIKIGDSDYLVMAKPILDSTGKTVATIVIPKDVTLEQKGIREQDAFNFAMIVATSVIATLIAGTFLKRTLFQSRKKPSLQEALKAGEGQYIEFKRSLDWDFGKNARDPNVRLSVLKTIVAFLNSEGGILLIGVCDDSIVEGIAPDLNLFKGSRDKFTLHFRGIITEKIGLEFATYIRDRAEEVNGKTVWIVEVDKGHMEAFVKWEGSDNFFIRKGPRTLELNAKQTVQYVRRKDWGE